MPDGTARLLRSEGTLVNGKGFGTHINSLGDYLFYFNDDNLMTSDLRVVVGGVESYIAPHEGKQSEGSFITNKRRVVGTIVDNNSGRQVAVWTRNDSGQFQMAYLHSRLGCYHSSVETLKKEVVIIECRSSMHYFLKYVRLDLDTMMAVDLSLPASNPPIMQIAGFNSRGEFLISRHKDESYPMRVPGIVVGGVITNLLSFIPASKLCTYLDFSSSRHFHDEQRQYLDNRGNILVSSYCSGTLRPLILQRVNP